jgi:hypothetical protein
MFLVLNSHAKKRTAADGGTAVLFASGEGIGGKPDAPWLPKNSTKFASGLLRQKMQASQSSIIYPQAGTALMVSSYLRPRATRTKVSAELHHAFCSYKRIDLLPSFVTAVWARFYLSRAFFWFRSQVQRLAIAVGIGTGTMSVLRLSHMGLRPQKIICSGGDPGEQAPIQPIWYRRIGNSNLPTRTRTPSASSRPTVRLG